MPKKLEELIQGYKKAKSQHFGLKPEYFNDLAENGQKPEFLIVACADSRVDPALVLKSRPGDLFVVRNVANLVPPYEEDGGHHGTSAALEFGIKGLKIKHIIIFGHSECGGIRNLLTCPTENEFSFVARWMDIAHPVRDQIQAKYDHVPFDDKANICAQYSIKQSLQNLLTFPWIKDAVDRGELFLHGWYFNLKEEQIYGYVSETDMFKPL